MYMKIYYFVVICRVYDKQSPLQRFDPQLMYYIIIIITRMSISFASTLASLYLPFHTWYEYVITCLSQYNTYCPKKYVVLIFYYLDNTYFTWADAFRHADEKYHLFCIWLINTSSANYKFGCTQITRPFKLLLLYA